MRGRDRGSTDSAMGHSPWGGQNAGFFTYLPGDPIVPAALRHPESQLLGISWFLLVGMNYENS